MAKTGGCMKPCFLATGIGSVPFDDADRAVELILRHFPGAPFWSQMPRLGVTERMEAQFSSGMPCAVIDREKQRLWFDTSGDYSEAFAEFYEYYIAATDPDAGSGDFSAMAIGPDYSHGIPALERLLAGSKAKLPIVKLQVTGPVSFALTITDENKRALWYNEEFRDIVIKALAMKCRWQIQKFRQYADRAICFIDEPILSAFGSSTYVSVKREDVVAAISEVVEAVHAEGALAGVHCCGNTEWSIPIDAGTDIVSFDAYGYGDTVAMYPDAMRAYFARGGMLAWGIVPTGDAMRTETVETLEARLESVMDGLTAKGIGKQAIIEQAFITPSCGTGPMEPADAERVFELAAALSARMKAKYGFM